ncbi:hypothetical protein HQ886_12965 [Enterococcus faecium]|nr:hypothetical protein [Enterococcus faecium]EME8119989.1 hypothetical protein [Enterococcus faecium]NTQ65712.1 hypothetical protein [Enterococcus faecium]
MDESGKKKNEISLIGSIVVPNNFYYSERVRELNKRLRNKELNFHLTEYRKDKLVEYLDLFDLFVSSGNLLRFNVVAFKRGRFKSHMLSSSIDDMVYSKIPERSIYGSLRGYSSFTEVEADIFIEYSTDYAKRGLDKLIKKQLNIHSLYRYDHFKILSSKLTYKNTEIGVEFTDACLGVLRNILENKDIKAADSHKISKSLAYKKHLVHELIVKYRSFFEHIDLFELDDKGLLERVDMRKYMNLFESKYLMEKENCKEIAELYEDITPKKIKRKPRKVSYR